ncbi:uncharacterized protein FFM5_15319 [Fusarium fujikuroi]|jgi:hypothetical protein
MNPN